MNRFLLGMLSPAWRTKLCGGIGIKGEQLLDMDEEDPSLFLKVVALGCGNTVAMDGGLEELVRLARMADKYQVAAILADVEQAVLDRLTVDNCGLILSMISGSGLVRLERASRELALREFDHFAESQGFMDVSEEVLGSLLDDDALISESEELVLKGIVRWMKGKDEGEIRGEGLLRNLQDPVSVHARRISCR